jgi:isopenicillin N synthase-like dioxygenase
MKSLAILSFVILMRVGGGQINSQSVPIIDISPWVQSHHGASIEKDQQQSARAIDEALQSHGCFLVTGHGLEADRFDTAMSSAYQLFALEDEIKKEVEVKGGGFMRGYIGFGKESGLEEYFESKEGYSYGYPWDENSIFENLLQGRNVWPPAEVGAVDIETFSSMFSLSSHVAVAIMKALSFYYLRETNKPLDIDLNGGDTISIMRLFHYFSSPPAHSLKKPIGSSPHTDWGLLTVITQEEGTDGLQLYLPSQGGWTDIPSIPGTMVVNGGDFLRLASGGRYVSPVHRVLSPSARDRISYVFFFYPNYNTLLPDSTGTCSGSPEEKEGVHDSTAAGSFNTLTCLEDSSLEANERISFGDYITRKWTEVYRSTEPGRGT